MQSSYNSEWAFQFLEELSVWGVNEFVISPGSRSTPLTLAAFKLSRLNARCKTHVVLDERSAGFIALGIGSVTKRPAALICTSGSALSNYMPAVCEAAYAHIPMLIVSADRPGQLQHLGASQTMNQQHFFGDKVCFYVDMGLPDFQKPAYPRIRAQQCIHYSTEKRGPVHVNFPFQKPLEPSPSWLTSLPEKPRPPRHLNVHPCYRKTLDTFHLEQLLEKSKRPIAVAGPGCASMEYVGSAVKFLEEHDIPLLAELNSNLSNSHVAVSGFDSFLRFNHLAHSPDLILRFGRQPVGKALNSWLATQNVPQIQFFADVFWDDPDQSEIHFTTLSTANKGPSISADWFVYWKSLEAKSKKNEHFSALTFTDGEVIRRLAQSARKKGLLFLGNSFSVRDADLFHLKWPHPVFVNRGLSGIDGNISTALGLALGNEIEVTAIVGDLTFLHDSNALLSAPLLSKIGLRVIVINNGGGTIFNMLPIHDFEQVFETYFLTPQKTNLQALCLAHSVTYRPFTQAKDLSEALEKPIQGLEVFDCKTDAGASMKQRKALWNIDYSI